MADEVLHMVCKGATCTCDKAVSPAPIPMKILSHNKFVINDDGSKLLATTKENNVASLNFSQCKHPDPSKPGPCVAQLTWEDFYENVTLPGGAHVLTEKSTAKCSNTGKITIVKHGQQTGVTAEEVAEAAAANWHNSLAPEDATILQQDTDDTDAKGAGVSKIAIVEGQSVYPVGSTLNVKVVAWSRKQPTQAEKDGVNWLIMDEKFEPLSLRQDTGEKITAVFNKPGKYVVNAYGNNPATGKPTKSDAVVYVTIKENEITGISNDSGGNKVRPGTPVTFTLKKLFPTQALPGGDEVKWTVDGDAQITSSTNTTATVVGNTADKDFTVIANGKERSAKIKVMNNRLTGVSANRATCRIHDKVEFNVKDDFELKATEEELAMVRWVGKDETGKEIAAIAAMTGDTIEYKFDVAGTFKIQAYLKGPSEKVKATVTVEQPKLATVFWRDRDGNKREISGWNERTYLEAGFLASEDLKVSVEIGITDKDRSFQKVIFPAQNIIVKDGKIITSIYLDKKKLEGKVKDGDLFYAYFRSQTPGYDIINSHALQPVKLLKLKTGEEILAVKFFKDNKAVSTGRYGDKLTGRVYVRSLSTNEITVEIYRQEKRLSKDWARMDTKMHSGKYKITEDGYAEFDFELKAEWEKDYKVELQHFYVVVKENEFWNGTTMTLTAFPKGVIADGKGATATVEDTKKKDKGDGCPNCGGTVKKEQMEKMFPKADPKVREEVMNVFNEAAESFGVNTCKRKSHFWAQIMEEVGESLEYKNENFNYSTRRLKNGWEYRDGKTWVKGNAKTGESGYYTDGTRSDSPYSYFTSHPDDAEKFGRKDLNKFKDGGIQAADQESIANTVYANQYGNKDFNSGDGWRYKGRGLIQLTFHDNYENVNNHIKQKYKAANVNLMEDGVISTARGAVMSALGFWSMNGLNAIADQAGLYQDRVDNVTKKVNSKTKSYPERRKNFGKTKRYFNLRNCKFSMEEDFKELKIEEGIKWLESIAISDPEKIKKGEYLVPYSNDGDRNTDKGLEKMDCSELVCRYLQKIEWSEKVEIMITATMHNYAAKHSKYLEIRDDDYTPGRGEIFIWKNQDGGMGHTGVVIDYDAEKDMVTTIEAIAEDAYENVGHDGIAFKGVVKWTYDRKGFHLLGHYSKKSNVTPNRFYTPRVHYSKAKDKDVPK